MGTALLEIRIIALLSTALLEIRIITLLVRVAEALLAVILLLSIALLLAAGLLVTAGLITILLITAIACAVLLLIASAVFQAVIESRVGNFHIRGNIKSGETAGNARQEIPENEGKIQHKFIHLMSVHHVLTLIYAFHHAFIRIFRKYVNCLGITVHGNDSGNPQKQ